METAVDQAAYMQDQQKTMFEEATSFANTQEAEAEPEFSYDAPDAGEDSLPDEAPDEDVLNSAAASSSTETADAATAVPATQHEQSSSPAEAHVSSPEALTVMTIDDFSALEERVLRAVNLVRRERQARLAAEERLLVLESQVLAQAPALEQLQQEIEALRAEREQVRQRVERLLSQLDALEL